VLRADFDRLNILVGDHWLPLQAGIISAPDCGTMRVIAILAPANACTTWL
jgi:hypothetical protein